MNNGKKKLHGSHLNQYIIIIIIISCTFRVRKIFTTCMERGILYGPHYWPYSLLDMLVIMVLTILPHYVFVIFRPYLRLCIFMFDVLCFTFSCSRPCRLKGKLGWVYD